MAGRKSILTVALFVVLTGSCFAVTEQDLQNALQSILTEFNTDLNTQLGAVQTNLNDLLSQVQTTVVSSPAMQDAYSALGSKATNAKAPPLAPFNCDPQYFKSPTPPTDVNKLMIGDINIVAALGDSVMAGLGTISHDLTTATTFQGRGYCSKIGGTGTVAAGNTTVSTIMRDLFLNANLKGYSVADGSCLQTDVTCAKLNVANIQAFHPDYILQALELLRRILFDATYVPTDWKMIHVFYGINDMCLLCQDIHYQTGVMAGLDLRIALRLLRFFLKNVIVYLHIPYDLTPLKQLSTNAACSAIQNILCPCAVNLVGLTGLGATVKSNQGLIAKIYTNLINDPKLNGSDFTMSEIKHLTNTQPPKDASGNYMPEVLSANCLHPSRAAHYIHARYVVNEMFTAPADRPLSGDYTVNTNIPIAIKCPTAASPYLRTYYN